MLLTILTFGIFRFWALTRTRRLVWSRMRVQGERLDYTGTGWELLRATLIVAVLFFAVQLAGSVVLELAPLAGQLFGLALLLAILVLTQAAVFGAQRYRLSRTLWCGIRGGMHGSMVDYGAKAFFYWTLAPISLLSQLRHAQTDNRGGAQASPRISSWASVGRRQGDA